jgi:hypothetical protein
MAPPKELTIRPDELFAHARAVAQMQQPFDYLRAATKAASPDGINMAYGLYCQPIGLALSSAQNYAEDVVAKLSNSVDAAVNQLTEAVDEYVTSDDQATSKLRAIGTEIPSGATNKHIADGTRWDWKNYNPADGGVFTNMDKKNWAKGSGLVGDVWDLWLEVDEEAKRNYATMAGHVASISVNVAGMAGDPVGSLASGLAGWALEHIKPFKLILDGLAGNPDMVGAAAETWKKIAAELDRLAGHYSAAVDYGTGNWNGDAGESYRGNFASPIQDALKATATLTRTLSVVAGTAGEMVNMVRSLARDLTAQAVGMLAVAAASRLGYKPPLEELNNVRYTLKTLKGVVSFLIVFCDQFAKQIMLVLEACKTVAAVIPKLNGV